MSIASRVSALATAAGAALKAHKTDFHGGEFGRGVVSTTAPSTNNTTTLANIAGLSFPVVSGARYGFRFVIPFNTTAIATAARVVLNGPTFTQLNHRVTIPSSTTAMTVSHSASYGTPGAASGSSAVTNGNIATIEGVIVPSAAGNLSAQFASETNGQTITIPVGAYVEWIKLS